MRFIFPPTRSLATSFIFSPSLLRWITRSPARPERSLLLPFSSARYAHEPVSTFTPPFTDLQSGRVVIFPIFRYPLGGEFPATHGSNPKMSFLVGHPDMVISYSAAAGILKMFARWFLAPPCHLRLDSLRAVARRFRFSKTYNREAEWKCATFPAKQCHRFLT